VVQESSCFEKLLPTLIVNSAPNAHEAALDRLNVRRSGQSHVKSQFSSQQRDDPLNSGLAKRSQPKQIGAGDPYGLSAESQCLKDIGASPKASVNHDRNLASHRFDDFRKGFNRSSYMVELPRAVVGHNDSGNT
jgi:hypothetical protein